MSIYHSHVPKTGGTSVNWAFLALVGDPETLYTQMGTRGNDPEVTIDGRKFVGWDTGERMTDAFYGFSHARLHTYRAPWAKTVFTVLRNPVDRLISQWAELQWFVDTEQKRPEVRGKGRMLNGDILHYLDTENRALSCRQLAHFSGKLRPKQALETLGTRTNYVLFTHSLGPQLRALGKKLGLPLQPRHDRKRQMPETYKVSAETRTELERRMAVGIAFYEEAVETYDG